MSSTEDARSNTLRETCHAFCKALESPPHLKQLMSTYFTSTPSVTEHGPAWSQSRLPFIGQKYSGQEKFLDYFNILGSVLSMKVDSCPAPDHFAVQPNAKIDGQSGSGIVFVQGGGEFKSIKTGKSWRETFVYRFSGFDEEGKIGHWEIWADSLSAWDAVGDGDLESKA